MASANIQGQIEKIWAQALGKPVAADDNFFALGGHSLLGVKVLAAIQEKLKLEAELSLSELVEHPTLEEFSDFIETTLMADEDSGTI
jgi:aryl carrier-like protein